MQNIMKGFLYTLLFVFILSLVCVVTCPDKDAHSEALMKLFNVAWQTELAEITTNENEGWMMLGSALGSGVAEYIIDKQLIVDNYFVCSIGRFNYDGEENIVSLGVLNHIFTKSEEDLLRELEDRE